MRPSTRLFLDIVYARTTGGLSCILVATLRSLVGINVRVCFAIMLEPIARQGWKATLDCSPYGKRDEQGDRSCSDVIPSSSSGFCMCEDGKRTAYSDCRHTPFTCEERCALLPERVCDSFDPSLRSNAASGCAHTVPLTNTLDSAVDIFRVNDHGIDVHLLTLPQHTNYTVVFVCCW